MADRKEDWEVSYIDSDGTFVGPVTGAVTGAVTGDVTGNVSGYVIFPAADPLVAGAWWDNAGTLTKSAG